jgi:transcriptional regulator of arginine metabolism
MTKTERQQKIIELIGTYNISTQTELTNKLVEMGYDVTQATISRDLQEMRIMKVTLPDGTYKYAASNDSDIRINDKLQNVFEQCLVSVDYANNLVVLKTISGAAQAVGYALDSFTWEEIVGSIAGDDTIMIVVRNEKSAKQLCAKLLKYLD